MWGSEGIAPFTLNLSTRWRIVVSITALLILLAKKVSRCPLDRRLGEPHRQTGHYGEEKNLLVNQMAVGQIFHRVLLYLPVSLIPSMLLIHSFFYHCRYNFSKRHHSYVTRFKELYPELLHFNSNFLPPL
jgi:hypothetical protein